MRFFLTSFLFLSLIFSSSLYAKERRVDLRWDFVPSIKKEVDNYRLEVVQIIEGEHHLVLSRLQKESNYIWQTDLFGFFIMRVFPINKNGKLVQNAEMEKPLYWEGDGAVISSPPRFLCDKFQSWEWERIPGKGKFLFRLVEQDSGISVVEKVLRKNALQLMNSQLIPQHRYRLLLLAYDSKGKIELIKDEMFTAKHCAERPAPQWHEAKEGNTQFFYAPKWQSRNQQMASPKNYSGMSWLGFGAGFSGDETKRWNYRGKFVYSSFCSELSFCQDELEIQGVVRYRQDNNLFWQTALVYQNLSLLNMRAYEQNGREVEDRVHLFTLKLGALYRFFIWRKQSELSGYLNHSPFSLYQTGDPNYPSGQQVSGYGVDTSFRIFLNANWQLLLAGQYQLLQGVGDTSMMSFTFGPVYQY